MNLKKLALATAIAALPMTAMAVDNLDDAMLGDVTGQDGIVATLDLALNGVTVYVHDLDGLDGLDPKFDNATLDYATAAATVATNPAAMEGAGAIVISGMNVNATGVVATIDAGDSAATTTAPVLNINVNLVNGATVDTGTIAVANSARDDGPLAWGLDGLASATLLDSMAITVGANTQLNIQLGSEPQGHMILVDTTIGGGLDITGFAMYDRGAVAATSGGAIGASTIGIDDAGIGTDLNNVRVGIDVDEAAGLVISILGLGTGGMDVRAERVYLGSAALGYIGDVEMTGVDLAGTTIAVTGK